MANVNYYQLPTTQENRFILPYINNVSANGDLLANYVDSTGQYARLTTFMQDVPTDRMEQIEADLIKAIQKIFPEKTIYRGIDWKIFTLFKGNALSDQKIYFYHYCWRLFSLPFFMAYMFRSLKNDCCFTNSKPITFNHYRWGDGIYGNSPETVYYLSL